MKPGVTGELKPHAEGSWEMSRGGEIENPAGVGAVVSTDGPALGRGLLIAVSGPDAAVVRCSVWFCKDVAGGVAPLFWAWS